MAANVLIITGSGDIIFESDTILHSTNGVELEIQDNTVVEGGITPISVGSVNDLGAISNRWDHMYVSQLPVISGI